jgi:hypothetical protein
MSVPFNYYEGALPERRPIRLYRFAGGKVIDWRKLRYNFKAVEHLLNNLGDLNFMDYACIAKTKMSEAIVSQDEITNQPRADLTNVTYNLIPRLYAQGHLPMPNSSSGTKDRLISPDGKIRIYAQNTAVSHLAFVVESAVRVYLSTGGWALVAPAVGVATYGFAVQFDEAKSIWNFYRDNVIVGVVDGNRQTSNFVTAEPTTTAEAAEAYIYFNQTGKRIEFWCKTVDDAAIKGCGYIDETGYHDGAGA